MSNYTARTAYRNNVAQGYVMVGTPAESGRFTFDEDLAIMGTKDDVAAELRRLGYFPGMNCHIERSAS